eukprot:CCRYP_007602-RB/>CCRYP_007602-RB protein AED:0.04 eAED:0.04 QI:225/0.66/0.71/1/0.83/0.85/7/4139/542
MPTPHESISEVGSKDEHLRETVQSDSPLGQSQPLYWSVLHHKNVNAHSDAHVDVGIPRVIREQEPLIKELSSKSDLSVVQYGSVKSSGLDRDDAPYDLAKKMHRRKWSRVRELVKTNELFVHYMPDDCDDKSLIDSLSPGHKGTHALRGKWSDINDAAYELTLRECLLLTLLLLACGVLAYSYLFESWPILDSLYFTTVLLTTVGYGDITPSTHWGKLFASVFALGGIVILGLALGVIGSRLVEAEIAATEKMREKSSKALESAMTRSQRHHRLSLLSSYGSEHSLSSLESVEAAVDRVCTTQQVETPREDSLWSNVRFGWGRAFSLVQQYFPGFGPLLIGGLGLGQLEDWCWVDSIYYCVVTSTTIGFGDIVPIQPTAKIFAILFIPLAVAAMGYILGQLASIIVGETKKRRVLQEAVVLDLKIEDLDILDTDGDGEVNELEYIRFMLVAMKKVDAKLFDDLHQQFLRMDATGDGKITKNDLKIMAARKMRKVNILSCTEWLKVNNKLALSLYKSQLQKKRRRPSFTAAVIALGADELNLS